MAINFPMFKKESSNNSVGVVGGGQLAKMLVESARTHGVNIVVQSENSNNPAAKLSNKHLLADPKDILATKKLVESCYCVTFENEWIDVEGLKTLKFNDSTFLPSLSALTPLIDKLSQKKILREIGIKVSDWIELCTIDLKNPSQSINWNYPFMAKARKGGYDGKGTRIITNITDLISLINNEDPSNWFLERMVNYEEELALVVSRDRKGKVRFFPLVRTHQNNQICEWVIAPADVPHEVSAFSQNIASSLLNYLDYVGVLAIEFFWGPEGLIVNEIAPRTHNSAHFTIEACESSQFDHQLFISAGLNVPNSNLKVPGALMVNLLGLQSDKGNPLKKRIDILSREENFYFHWYGKDIETPGRKLGHITVLLHDEDPLTRLKIAKNSINHIRSIWSN